MGPNDFTVQNSPFGSLCEKVVIGLENRSGVSKRAWQDPSVKEWLQARNFVAPGIMGGSGGPSFSKLIKDEYFTSSRPQQPNITKMFEDTLYYGFAPMLRNFSIGPTQQNLYFTGPSMGGGNVAKNFPRTWDDIYRIYMQMSIPSLLTNAAGYLGAGPNNDSDESVILWLKNNQTGFGEGVAEGYYFGTGIFANARGVKKLLSLVKQQR
jgi:hypothetical protein